MTIYDDDNKSLNRVVGANIRSHRTAMHLSQEALAEKLDISKNYIGQLENGLKYPSSDTASRLCKVFDIEYYELFFDSSKLNLEEERSRMQEILQKASDERVARAMGILFRNK